MSFEARIKELGLILPETPRPVANFVPAVQVGNLIFVSGQTPTVSGQLLIKGTHARAAIGVAELPFGAPVELELIVEVQQ